MYNSTILPSRELDALVAEKVMGMPKWSVDQHRQIWSDGALSNLPHYSTDIAAAWEVVEKTHLFRDKQPDGTGYCDYVELWQGDDGAWKIGNREDQLFILAEGDTAPHAICLAALKACGVKT